MRRMNPFRSCCVYPYLGNELSIFCKTYEYVNQATHTPPHYSESGPFKLNGYSSDSDLGNGSCSDNPISSTLHNDTEQRRANIVLSKDTDSNVQFWIDCAQSRVPGVAALVTASFDD